MEKQLFFIITKITKFSKVHTSKAKKMENAF